MGSSPTAPAIMNIFVLDLDPKLAARYLCDKHVVKMIVESCQLLCSVFDIKHNPPYKRTHYNHPCAKWVRRSASNFNWLYQHTIELLKEYERRYDTVHSCITVVNWITEHINLIKFPKTRLTPFPVCMPEECKLKDPVSSYRNYYIKEKSKFAKWRYTIEPPWYKYEH